MNKTDEDPAHSIVWREDMKNIQENTFLDCGSFLVWSCNKDVGAGCWELTSGSKPGRQGD